MSDERLRDYLKRVTIDLHDARQRLRELEDQGQEPIAIVGMSCRYPGGVGSPEELWELVSTGVDAIGEFPSNRGWDIERIYHPDPEHPGTSYTREGGFLYDVPEFDADFFSITPREALAMDPQQRLLLEISWELFEHAGIDPAVLRGSRTAVLVGGTSLGYAQQAGSTPEEVQGYLSTGNLASVLSGRIAYAFGLEGPAVTVDTGCSSSLVALHTACGYLRRRECSLALAGGVAVLSGPAAFQEFSRQRGLARDGRCKSYANAADGTGWSEGAGLLLVERLADAQRFGHRVWAVVRGSAINQDGASNGLAAPNGRAQQRVVRAALSDCGLSPEQVDVVEGHGTGTTLGDPIEAQALLASYGRARPSDRPLWLGSIKSNIGHSQAAAGAAGLIKMVMALQHGILPRTLHVDEPSRQVDWSVGNVSLLTEARDWPESEEPRRAGVSSFGVSGTNAHVILEQAPQLPEDRSQVSAQAPQGTEQAPETATQASQAKRLGSLPPIPWVLSAKGVPTLREQARRLLGRLDDDARLSPVDVGFSLAAGRSALRDRAVVLGQDRDLLSSGLRALAQGEDVPSLLRGAARSPGSDLAFLFTGQGAQRVGMGCELYRAFAAFRAALDAVCDCLDPLLGRSLLDVMFATGAPSGTSGQATLDQTAFTQPALFALEVALYRLLERWGVKPDFLLGHSIGELAAVHVAGALSLEDACALAAARGRLMGALPQGGAMVALQASEQEASALIEEHRGAVAIAAVNGPRSVVISGEQEPVLRLAAEWEREGHKTKRLQVSHAFHCSRMDGMLEELAEVAAGLSFSEPAIAVVSNLDGEPLTLARMRDPRYWADHARRTVRFADGVRWLAAQGVQGFFELGPDGVLSAMVRECIVEEDMEKQPLALPALRRQQPEAQTLIGALAQIWCDGIHVDWKRLYDGSDARRVQLPTYPFQRRYYWLEGSMPSPSVPESGAPAGNPPDNRGAGQTAPDSLRDALHNATAQERRHLLLTVVRTEVARIVGHPSVEAVDPKRTFKDFGFDSLMALELRSRLQSVTRLTLPKTLAFNHPTSSAIADHLLERLQVPDSASEQPEPERTGSQQPAKHRAPMRREEGDSPPVEPLAIVGVGCRYPGGVGSQEQLWELVADGRDAVSKLPVDRGWDIERIYDPDPDVPGTTYTDEGGFLHDAAEFDASFFGIGSREALMMDPQQRLFLEVSWEAVERAGIDPTSLRGTRTGVFAGLAGQDYAARLSGAARSDDQLTYMGMGASASVLSGRLAYLLDLRGPAFTVDAACSSSLVALHLACESLRKGECDLALTGGVTVLSTPFMLIVMSRQRALAPDGRCKSFADAADGMGFAEGAGMVVLERLSDARRLGHDVLALVRGSAVNQDGTSNGLAAPNGLAQERVIRQALASAGLDAIDVDAVEAHGTGTMLGDPIEAEAILATYGCARPPERPLWLGSVKSNIGHTQAAAGIAGVIKMAMALRHELLPRTLHVDAPSTQVDWGLGNVALLTEPVRWTSGLSARRAAVSAFGVSGTNAHVILEEPAPADRWTGSVPGNGGQGAAERQLRIAAVPTAASAVEKDTAPEEPPLRFGERKETAPEEPPLRFGEPAPLAWVLSAKGAGALREQASRLRNWVVQRPSCEPSDLAYSLASTRSAFERRAVVVGEGREQLVSGLAALAGATPASTVVEGSSGGGTGQVVLVFPGQGSQWAGMASELLDSSPVFARHIQACELALAPHTDWVLSEVLRNAPDAPSLERLDVLQPVLFSVMVSLTALWRACGVSPAAVVGHSQGEIAAVCAAGGLSLSDAARLVARRSRALLGGAGTGEMASIGLGARELAPLLKLWEERLFIAACNGPSATVVSGQSQAVQELLEECKQRAIRARQVAGVFGAGHSPHVEPLREQLLESSGQLDPLASDVAFYSTVTAARFDTAAADGEYWYRNAREPVQFEGAIRRLLDDGFRTFVEVSPHPILAPAIAETIEEHQSAQATGCVVPSLRRGEGGPRRFLTSLGEAWTHGAGVDWGAILGAGGARRVALPTYAFQRRRYWAAGSPGAALGLAGGGGSGDREPIEDMEMQVEPERGVLVRRLSQGAPPARAEIIVSAVCEQVGAMLSDIPLDAIDPDRNLLELGFDSTMAVELATRLSSVSDLRIPTRALFDRPTPAALAVYLDARLEDVGGEDVGGEDVGGEDVGGVESEVPEHREGAYASETNGHAPIDGSAPIQSRATGDRRAQDTAVAPSQETLKGMLRTASQQGKLDRFMPMLMAASQFRPSFDAGRASELSPEWVTLRDGPALPSMLCLPTALALSGPHQYVKLARSLPGDRTVAALSLPGFGGEERLPASLEAVVEALALAVEQRSAGTPFALVGYSSGGWLANALASRLESARDANAAPAALVLLDAPPSPAAGGASLGALLDAHAEALADDVLELVSDRRLTAMGAYLRLLSDWQPTPVRAPTLLLRAAESWAGDAARAAVDGEGPRTVDGEGLRTVDGESPRTVDGESPPALVNTEIEVPGDHFSLLDEHVEATAKAVEGWMGEWMGQDVDRPDEGPFRLGKENATEVGGVMESC